MLLDALSFLFVEIFFSLISHIVSMDKFIQ